MAGNIHNCKVLGLIALLVMFAALSGCGGGSSAPPSPIAVFVTPSNVQVLQGGVQVFTAGGTGTTNTSVNWTVLEGAGGGSITSAGIYTAPKAAGTFHVVATSVADSSKSASAIVTVPQVNIFVNPSSVSMGTGESFAFAGFVSGATNQGVSWSIQEGAAGGTITGAGVYTSPNAFGTFHVVATSQWDTSKTAVAPATVEPVSVSTFPSSDVLGTSGVRTFTATVLGTVNHGVTWSVLEGSGGGSISQSGDYTAPSVTGTFHAVATSVKDPTKSASSTVNVISSGFRPTGSMHDARSAATATVVSGRVLVAGGDGCLFFYYYGLCPLFTAELFDPATGTFTSTASMFVRRSFHTATLLSNGKVLLAGGGSGGGSGLSAELYDPTLGSFLVTGNMTVARSSHTATLLLNGNVLIAGGQGISGSLSSSEEYNPASGTFSAKGNMTSPRAQHTATRLGNGKVLIVGGVSQTPLASAELYDPATGTFAATGSMAAQRSGHTAVVLPNGNVLVAGGANGQSILASAEIYDVASGIFTPTSSMMAARSSHFAIPLVSGKVLIAGGISDSPMDFTAELYDPLTGLFSQTGSLGRGRIFAAATLLPDGSVLVVGGSDLNSAEIYK